MNRKTYLSRAQTRAMAFDHPIGDPFGGAAYGEKNDPVSTGFALYEMYTAYEVGFAAMSVWQGIATVGAALTLVGNATGNSKLSKIGTLAMAGGSLGQSIGSTAEGGWASSGGVHEATGLGELAPVSDAVPVPVGEIPPPSSTAPPVDAPVNTGPATDLNTGPSVKSVDLTQPGGGTNPVNSPLKPPPVPEGGVEVVDRVGTATNNPIKPAVDPKAATGVMDKLASNPMALYAGAAVIGQVGDYLSGKTDAEIDAMKAQTGYNNAKALETQALLDKEKLRRANLNSGYTNVDTSMKVNPNAQISRPWDPRQAAAPAAPAGLIAGARTA